MTKDDERIKDWRSTGRKRLRKVLLDLVAQGELEYKCNDCGLIPTVPYTTNSRSGGLDANHKNKDVTDCDPANGELLCRVCHYKADRATAKGISSVEEDYGYDL